MPDLTINDYDIIYILWNITLGIIPFFLVLLLFRIIRIQNKIRNYYISIIGFIWLIFAPNAPYIITDIRHINGFCPKSTLNICIQNAWMIVFFFLYGVIGWVLYFYSIEQMLFFLRKITHKKIVALFPILIVPVFSLGILLGLVDRLNSWDIFLRLDLVVKSALNYFFETDRFIDLVVFSVIMLLLYYFAKLIFKPIEACQAFKYFIDKN